MRSSPRPTSRPRPPASLRSYADPVWWNDAETVVVARSTRLYYILERPKGRGPWKTSRGSWFLTADNAIARGVVLASRY